MSISIKSITVRSKEMEILSIEIKEDGKRYKLIDTGKDDCEGCAFNRRYVPCPFINGELSCMLTNGTSIWKEIKK